MVPEDLEALLLALEGRHTRQEAAAARSSLDFGQCPCFSRLRCETKAIFTSCFMLMI